MKPKHTPGPWIIRDRTGTIGNPAMGIEGPGGEVIARIIYQDGFATLKANATLIAAAPELLATLRKIGVWLIAPRTDVQTIAEMNTLVSKAIAKAEGREQ